MFRTDAQSNTAKGRAPLDLERLRGIEPAVRLAGRNVSKAEINLYRLDALPVAVKDYGRRPFLVRHTAGRFFTRREVAAYRAAAGIEGLPEFLGRLGPCALAVRWIDGAPLSALAGKPIDPSFFDRVAAILDALHARGIALADLHHRDVLVGRDGTAWIVDLASAWIASERAGRLRRALFRKCRDLDRVALARMRARFAGADEHQAMVAAAGPSAAALHAFGRRIRTAWDWLRGKRRGGYDQALARLRLLGVYALLAALLYFSRPTPLSVSLGFVAVALGEAVRLWAAGYLLKTAELVTAGPYQFTRNPLYLGRLLIFTGLCVMAWLPYAANLLVMGLGWAVFFGYYLRRKERVEPERLREVHGEAFERYFRTVPALLPTFRPYPDAEPIGWSSERMLRNREHFMVLGLVLVTLFLLWRAYAPA